MEKIFKRTAQGAGIGGTVSTVLSAGAAAIFAPVSIPVMCAIAAVGTVIGGTAGVISGARGGDVE